MSDHMRAPCTCSRVARHVRGMQRRPADNTTFGGDAGVCPSGCTALLGPASCRTAAGTQQATLHLRGSLSLSLATQHTHSVCSAVPDTTHNTHDRHTHHLHTHTQIFLMSHTQSGDTRSQCSVSWHMVRAAPPEMNSKVLKTLKVGSVCFRTVTHATCGKARMLSV